MASSEFDSAEMVLLYNPAKEHRCNLPKLRVLNHKRTVEHRTIMECDQCAQRWWAYVDTGNYESNGWNRLRWYHFILRSKIT